MKESKVLFVTGASSDIGCQAIAQMADNYSCILAHYVHWNESLEKLRETLGDKLVLLQADFTDEKQILAMLERIEELNVEISHIIHLPSQRLNYVKFAKVTWDTYQRELEIGLKSAVMILQKLLPKMAKRKYGKIVMMLSSCTTNMPPKFMGAYVPVKYALLGLVKSLAVEYADKGITINGISPDMIETKFLQEISDLVIEGNAKSSPVGRNLQVQDVIPTIAFLLSDGADMINGQNIVISGGR